ncbi:hypothetical protein HGRIS_009014 [Hohenbuehelia grisea]|uniref:Polynucleotide 5'-hydroxyl-kinase GRC3 n=1 Tax=Hohenbuehelia grisea TaxID=104357 RepID=A0ABR3IZU7_9AGAR
MLSAIAARRAAQANVAKSPVVQTHEPATESAPEPSSPPRPKSKRKISAHKQPTPKKKQRTAPKPRYYEPQPTDDFNHQEDVITIDSDSDDSLPSGSEPEETIIPKRPYSPSAPVVDSSDEESIPDARDEIQNRPNPSDFLLSSFKPVADDNFIHLSADDLQNLRLPAGDCHAGVALRLLPAETICLVGSYTLTIISGSLVVSGVTLTASSGTHRVFAPKSSPVPVLQCLQSGGAVSDLPSTPQRLLALGRRGGCILILQELRSGVESLGRVCKTFENAFHVRSPVSQSKYDLRLPSAQMVVQPAKDVQRLQSLPSWDASISSLFENEDSTASPGIHLVKGPKNTGKSTFAMLLLNRLLTRYRKVAYLECDLGQSEFTPGGMVALHVLDRFTFGPAFTHPTLPIRAHYIGATTPRSSPSHYLSAIQSLVEFYRLDVETPSLDFADTSDSRNSEKIPLVINSMGWTKGLGADLMQNIEDIVQPTQVYMFDVPAHNSYSAVASIVPSILGSTTVHHTLEPASSSSLNFLPADYRTMNMLSYFYANFPGTSSTILDQATATSWDVSRPLCARAPYEVDSATAFDGVILTGPGSEDVVPSELERVLNGAIVGLVSCDSDALEMSMDAPVPIDPSTSIRIPYLPGAPPPAPSSSACHGLALVRSVSPQLAELHILTPIPAARLGLCRVLVKGEQQLPIWGMLDFSSDSGSVAGVEAGKVPYLQWGKGEGLGGERRRVRRNLMRKGQM